jgi:carboxyl-terminal processing protease
MKLRRPSLALVLGLLCPVLLVAGIYLGGHPDLLPGAARDTLVSDSDARIYDEAIDQIVGDYYRPIDRRTLLNRSLAGAVESLDDRFSNYFDPRDYASFQQQTSGAFVGVGVSVRDEKKLPRGLQVTEVYDGSPAKRAGIRPADLITEVDGRPLKGLSTEEATARIKGRAGTSVRLTFGRGDAFRTARLERDRVALPNVSSEIRRDPALGGEAVHATLESFTSGAHGELGQEIRTGLKKGAKGVVLDLRNNGGGLLNEAVLVSSIFLREGTVVSTKGRSKPRRVYTATGGAIPEDVPVVVLVNENSASASEIVTGALQDRKRAAVVGTRTFGKGVFQEVKQLSNGGALDITVGEYFLPSGRNLGGGGVKKGAGIKPDVRAEDDPDTARDEALDRALEVLATRRAR